MMENNKPNVNAKPLVAVATQFNLPADALQAMLDFAAFTAKTLADVGGSNEWYNTRWLADAVETELRTDRGYGDAPWADIIYICPFRDGRPLEQIGGWNTYDEWEKMGRNPHDCEKYGGAWLFLCGGEARCDIFPEPVK